MIHLTPVNDNNPISLELAKEHLRIIGQDEDSTLNLYIQTASSIFERFTKKCLINKTVEQVFDQFPCEDYFLLEASDLITFTSIQYYNKENTLTTLSSDKYIITNSNSKTTICLVPTLTTWASDIHETRLQAVKVSYTAGFGTTEADIPSDIKAIMLLIIGDLYANKEDTVLMSGIASVKVSWSATRLMEKYKNYFYEHLSQSRK